MRAETEPARSTPPSRAAAGEDPEGLRNLLKDAVQEPSTSGDEQQELRRTAREESPKEPAKKKRRWRRDR